MEAAIFGASPFIQGQQPQRTEPLSRYLPVFADGIVASWLKNNIAPGEWVIDPFCGSPKVAIEAAQAGYRVLVTVNNPITRFVLELLASPQTEDDLKAAIAALSSSFIGDERLEPHIRALYHTECAQCGQLVSADAFLWIHGNPSPYMRVYTCPNCGDSGEHPCTAYDVEHSDQFASAALHKARAIERVVAANDPDRIHVEQAVSVYNPRALYALVTIINKISGLDLSPTGRKSLHALLLYAFDQTHTMWKPSSQKEKPRQLTIPRTYRENNVWLALEEGIRIWSTSHQKGDQPIKLLAWPDISLPNNGISCYDGRFISIADSIKNIKIRAVCTSLPRPNQAYWTFSALWAGWLWGREAISNYKSVLHRQRYDWAWHTSALSSVFTQFSQSLEPSTPIFGLINDLEPGFIASALISASLAGCDLENISIRLENEQVQLAWRMSESHAINLDENECTQAAIKSARSYLELRGEPATYIHTISSALIGILNYWKSKSRFDRSQAGGNLINGSEVNPVNLLPEQSPSAIYSSAYNSSRVALSYRCGFLQYSSQETSNIEVNGKPAVIQNSLFSFNNQDKLDTASESEIAEDSSENPPVSVEKERSPRSTDIPISTLFWLRNGDIAPGHRITDRYELAVVDYLVEHNGITFQEIDRHLCRLFTGLFTPPIEFIQLCMESYAARDTADPSHWYLRPEDTPGERQADIEHAEEIIVNFCPRLNLYCAIQNIDRQRKFITWQDSSGEPQYKFLITPTAAFGDIVLKDLKPQSKIYVVIPGSRANIVFFKFHHDPRLSKAFNLETGSWRFLKFRHLRGLASTPILDRENLSQLLSLDPLTYSAPQLWLI